jgi:hypothetical protein
MKTFDSAIGYNPDKHYHCPYDCEHPQPIHDPNGQVFCGRCWHMDNLRTEMIECNKDICKNENI